MGGRAEGVEEGGRRGTGEAGGTEPVEPEEEGGGEGEAGGTAADDEEDAEAAKYVVAVERAAEGGSMGMDMEGRFAIGKGGTGTA